MYKVSAKRNGKWWAFGAVKKNQYGNLQLSFKNTAELKDLVNSGAEWLNFSLFDEEKSEAPKKEASEIREQVKAKALDMEIPF